MAENPFLFTPVEDLREAWFRPMGFSLRVTSNAPAVMAAAESAFAGFGPAAPDGSSDLSFRLFAHSVDDGVRGRPLQRADGPLVYQTTGRDSTLVADRAAGVAFGCFSSTTLADPAFFRWHFLEPALFFMLEWRGFIGVHGAALARGGKGLLLRAASGQGKTTLAYAATRRGFQALAEDVVWLDGARPLWWGTPWSFHLLPDARELFPELASATPLVQLNGETKLAADLEALRPGSTTPSARAGAVVLLSRQPGGRSRIEPLGPAAAREGWRQGGASKESEIAGYDSAVDRLLRHGAYRLAFGDDIEAAVDLLESIVA
ncbi:MAG TPA: hypothetical protein VOA87_18940 [Thermoanaerobaculia bacterium]|nr:hypothetical protein [Thermoanaerobaculia bacterium]